MSCEVGPAGLGCVDALDEGIVVFWGFPSGKDGLDVGGSLIEIALDVHGETGSLGHRKAEVESDNTGNSTETYEQAPHEINASQISH